MITITTYWNKLSTETLSNGCKKVLQGEYEVKDVQRVNNTLEDLKARWKNNPKMKIEKNRIVEDCGRSYGIHSYKIIERAAK